MRARIDGSRLIAVLCVSLFACSGDDDDEQAASCLRDASAGDELECACDDGGVGVQRCRADGKLGECDCEGSGGSAGSSGSGGSAGSAGRSGAGGSGGSDSGSGGDEDAGSDPEVTEDAGQSADGGGSELPTDGDQLAVCEEDGDCGDDLACYDPGPGQHFCTRTCAETADCAQLTGAEYTCSDDGLCEVRCENVLDTESCPDGLSCTLVRGPGGGQGGPQFRCKYSENAGQTGDGEAWSACLAPDDCDDGLECVGAFGPIPGYCTQACEESDECSEEPESGDIEPTCGQVGPMPSATACVLDCSDDAEGCPDDMMCGIGERCVY
jgi:hypothetical protein